MPFSVRKPTLITAFLLLLLAQTAHSAWILDYQGLLSPDHHNQGFQRPQSLSLDPSERELCVTDEGRNELRVFTEKDVFAFATGALSGLSRPASACLDPFGGFYFTDSREEQGRTVDRLNYRGEPVAFQPVPPVENWHPDHLILTRDGGIVTLDGNAALLAKHDVASGALLWRRKVGGEDAGESQVFGRLAEAPDGRLYIPSASFHLVFVHDAEGNRLGDFGEFRATRGGMVFPVGVAFGPGGNILVLDRMRHLVLLYDAEHRFLAEYGSFGGGEGQFYHPNAIAASTDGRVYVAQGYESRVQRFQLRSTGTDAPGPRAEAMDSLPVFSMSLATQTPSADLGARRWCQKTAGSALSVHNFAINNLLLSCWSEIPSKMR